MLSMMSVPRLTHQIKIHLRLLQLLNGVKPAVEIQCSFFNGPGWKSKMW